MNTKIGTFISKNLGQEIHSTGILLKDDDKCFITFMDSGWRTHWFPLLMNGRHLKFDDHFCMEIAREKFGHTSFGISCGQQSRMENDSRNNL
jgi:hypothetical protein